jgi:arylsulfatase A-like enzyme
LICVDTLRADRTSAYGYEQETTPALKAFAAQGALFSLAYAPVSQTAPSAASILTGQYPARHGLLLNGVGLTQEARTLAEILTEHGYQSAAVMSSFVLSERFGFAQGFEHFEDDFDPATSTTGFQKWEGHDVPAGFDRRGGDATRRAQRWLWERDRKRPFFLFVHYFDPHAPYSVPEGFRPMLPLPAKRDDEIGSSLDYRHEVRRYHEEIAYVDRQIARLLEAIEREGLNDDTLVIVTADHGEGLWDHGYWLHGLCIYEETVRVPLLARWPGKIRAGQRIADPVELVDLAPTVLELLGVEFGDAFDGKSLAGALKGEPSTDPEDAVYLYRSDFGKVVFDGIPVDGALYGVRRGKFKLIEHERGGGHELYDLERDPGERHNLIDAAPEQAAELRGLLQAWRSKHEEHKPAAPLSEDDRRALKALGYIGPSAER